MRRGEQINMKIKFIYLNIWQSTPELKRLINDGIITYARGEDYSEFYYLECNEVHIISELLKSIPKSKISMYNIKDGVSIYELNKVKKELGVCQMDREYLKDLIDDIDLCLQCKDKQGVKMFYEEFIEKVNNIKNEIEEI